MDKKKLIISISILIVIALAVSFYFVQKNRQKPVEKEVVSQGQKIDGIDTGDWETYRNDKYLFTFKYPNTRNIGLEFGSDNIRIELANEFYVGDLYVLVVGRENFKTLDDFIDNKVGSKNYNNLFDVNNGRAITVINKNLSNFKLKDGKGLFTAIDDNTDMVFIDGDEYYLLLLSRIGSAGIGSFSQEDAQIIKSIKID